LKYQKRTEAIGKKKRRKTVKLKKESKVKERGNIERERL